MSRPTARPNPVTAATDPIPIGAGRLSRALERVLDRFGRMIRSAGRARGLDEPDLDELVQDVRIRLWRAGRGEAESIEAFSTSYLYRTATAAAIDIIRRRRGALAAASDPLGERLASAADPRRDLALRELAAAVGLALAEIPESRRVVVQLHLAGYPKPEIASLLGYSFDKVRNLLYRGLADLRAALAADGSEWSAEP